jgi:hypothetical protein
MSHCSNFKSLKLLSAAITEVLAKPFAIKELSEAVYRALPRLRRLAVSE